MDINFYLAPASDKNGDCAIRVSVVTHGSRLLTSTGYKINPKMWEKAVQRVRRGAVNAKGMPSNIINAGLDAIRAHFGRLDDVSRTFIKDDLHREFLECMGRKPRKGEEEKDGLPVTDIIRRFVVEAGNRNGWTLGTVQKFGTLGNHLERYRPSLKLTELDRDCMSGLVVYFLDRNFTNSTVIKQMKLLKWFLRWAEDHGYAMASDWKKFSVKLKQPEKTIVFLDWDELMTVYNCSIPIQKQYLERVRDVFCFCCFTGLRYSDVANLHRSDVFPAYIRVTTIKTADTLDIDLNDYAKTILRKYEGEHYPGGLALPVISGQRMNEYLRELGEWAGLTTPIRQVYYSGSERIEEVRPKYEYLTTHCGRRTFICNALSLGVPVDVVMRWTGHSDYSAMKPYIAIADKVKAEEMKKFNRK